MELPCLKDIIENRTPWPNQCSVDSTLQPQGGGIPGDECSRSIQIATVNVGTLGYGDASEMSVSGKAIELMRQFEEADIQVVGVQESRAKVSATVESGSFTRIIAAGRQGQAGVELWINRVSLSRLFEANFIAAKDACVWFHDSRILCVRCSFGTVSIDFVVLYAPQRGRPKTEINQWWNDVTSVLAGRDRNIPLICLGDLNCSIGSITSSAMETKRPILRTREVHVSEISVGRMT